MVTKKLARARKAMAVALSATLFTGVAQGGGCTVNVDENLLQSLTGLLENVESVHFSHGGFQLNTQGPDQGDVADEPVADEPVAGDTGDGVDQPV